MNTILNAYDILDMHADRQPAHSFSLNFAPLPLQVVALYSSCNSVYASQTVSFFVLLSEAFACNSSCILGTSPYAPSNTGAYIVLFPLSSFPFLLLSKRRA